MEEATSVDLYIYDLTLGFASLLAPAIIGREVEGVWHTAVVAYGREFFYGGAGITSCAPGSTQLGAPQKTERLGQSFVPHQVFADYLQQLAATTFTAVRYSLLEHNCNHFSEELAQFLCGAHVPKHILHQPEQVLGEHRHRLQGLLDSLAPQHAQSVVADGGRPRRDRQDSPDYTTLNHQIEQARVQSAALEARRSTLADKLARKERKKDKKRNKAMHSAHRCTDMAEAVEQPLEQLGDKQLGDGQLRGEQLGGEQSSAGPSDVPSVALLDLEERRREEQLRRDRDPPIVYRDIDATAELEKLSAVLETAQLSSEERSSLEELRAYCGGEGSWVLGDDFLQLVARLLRDEALGAAAAMLRVLAALALRDDVALLLHQDRRSHALLHHAHNIDRLPLEQQRPLALFMCNLFENISSSEWLLYISEWTVDNHTLSNIAVTTKVCVHAALSSDAELQETGTALMYNVAIKEVKTVRFQAGKMLRDLLPKRAKSKVFDEVCVELSMALLQLLQQLAAAAAREELVYRALRALARLAQHSNDVPQLVQLVGPSPAAYSGTSARVDEQVQALLARCNISSD